MRDVTADILTSARLRSSLKPLLIYESQRNFVSTEGEVIKLSNDVKVGVLCLCCLQDNGSHHLKTFTKLQIDCFPFRMWLIASISYIISITYW